MAMLPEMKCDVMQSRDHITLHVIAGKSIMDDYGSLWTWCRTHPLLGLDVAEPKQCGV